MIEENIKVYKEMAKARAEDCINYQKEIERLNNIIDEIFEWMQNKYDNSDLTGFTVSFQELEDLKKLKEGTNER